MTPLEKPIKRELKIDDATYTLTIDPTGLKLVPKGKRNGIELAWAAIANGDAALASALEASVRA